MAKRTYHDGNGYKHKRRKRGTPEFSTIEEYQEHVANKRRASLKKTAEKKVVVLSAEELKRLESLEGKLVRVIPSFAPEAPLSPEQRPLEEPLE